MNTDLISRSALLADIQTDVEDGGVSGMVGGALKRYVKRAPAVDALPVDIVAQMLCDAIGDPCACNINGNDEWLSTVCDLQIECPYPKDGLGCWKQYIKHYGERRADDEA